MNCSSSSSVSSTSITLGCFCVKLSLCIEDELISPVYNIKCYKTLIINAHRKRLQCDNNLPVKVREMFL